MDAKLTSTEDDDEIIDLTEIIDTGAPIATPAASASPSTAAGREQAIDAMLDQMQADMGGRPVNPDEQLDMSGMHSMDALLKELDIPSGIAPHPRAQQAAAPAPQQETPRTPAAPQMPTPPEQPSANAPSQMDELSRLLDPDAPDFPFANTGAAPQPAAAPAPAAPSFVPPAPAAQPEPAAQPAPSVQAAAPVPPAAAVPGNADSLLGELDQLLSGTQQAVNSPSNMPPTIEELNSLLDGGDGTEYTPLQRVQPTKLPPVSIESDIKKLFMKNAHKVQDAPDAAPFTPQRETDLAADPFADAPFEDPAADAFSASSVLGKTMREPSEQAMPQTPRATPHPAAMPAQDSAQMVFPSASADRPHPMAKPAAAPAAQDALDALFDAPTPAPAAAPAQHTADRPHPMAKPAAAPAPQAPAPESAAAPSAQDALDALFDIPKQQTAAPAAMTPPAPRPQAAAAAPIPAQTAAPAPMADATATTATPSSAMPAPTPAPEVPSLPAEAMPTDMLADTQSAVPEGSAKATLDDTGLAFDPFAGDTDIAPEPSALTADAPAQEASMPPSPALQELASDVLDMDQRLQQLEEERQHGTDLRPLLEAGTPLHEGLTSLLRDVVGGVFDEKMTALGGSDFAEHFGNLEQRFGEVEQTISDVAMRFDDVEQRVNAFSERFTDESERFASIEEKLRDIGDNLAQQAEAAASAEMAALEQRCADLEDRLNTLENNMDARINAGTASAAARILREEIDLLLKQA